MTILQTIQFIIEFAIGVILLIFVHEFGHFLACKILGIEVEEFGCGFPPRAFTMFERGGTKFTVNWLPLGGFVRPKGELDPDIKGGLAAAGPWRRMGVMIAGPIMNLAVALILFFAIYAIMGTLPDRSRVQVVEVVPNSPAAQAGLQTGDLLESVGGIKADNLDTVHTEIYTNLGKPLMFIYQRDGVTHEVKIVPLTNPGSAGAVGISMSYPSMPFTVWKGVPESFTSLYDYAKLLFGSIAQVIRGQQSAAEVQPLGLVGMFDVYSYVRESPSTPGNPKIANVLSFFAIISFSLGIMNLLPIPPLDGGKIAFALPEVLIHRRIPAKYENLVSGIAFILLIGLMIYINAQNIIHPVVLPSVTP